MRRRLGRHNQRERHLVLCFTDCSAPYPDTNALRCVSPIYSNSF